MAGSQSDAARKSYGPYNVIDDYVLEGRTLVTLPFDNVKGCQLLVSVVDNVDILNPGAADQRFWAIAEVAIWGIIQGYATPIKRQHVRMISGPMEYVFPFEEAYDSIEVRGRNMTGGKSRSVPATDFVQSSLGFFINVNVLVNPRTGFDKGDGLKRDKPPMNWG